MRADPRSTRGGPCEPAGSSLGKRQPARTDTGVRGDSRGTRIHRDGYVFAANDTVAGWDLVIRTGPNLDLNGSDFIL